MRRQALAPLRALLLEPPPEAAAAIDSDFAATALERTTASEAANLLDWDVVASAPARRW